MLVVMLHAINLSSVALSSIVRGRMLPLDIGLTRRAVADLGRQLIAELANLVAGLRV